MKFIQSFWSKPFTDSIHSNNWNYRHNGGYPNPFLFYASWCYSCLSIKKYYPNLHLITDNEGVYIFRDVLKLPYTSFSTRLNTLSDYDKGLWALGKLFTYNMQDEPFCHLDGDVFLFGSVLDKLIKKPIFCQSFDHDTDQYAEIHAYVHSHFNHVPKFNGNLNNNLKLINAGIIGGTNIKIFQDYTASAFELINNNADKLNHINMGLLNLYYEQFLFSNIVEQQKFQVHTLFPETDQAPKFAAFHNIPNEAQYVHLISHLKKSTEFLELIVARLFLEFPEYYERLKNVFKKELL